MGSGRGYQVVLFFVIRLAVTYIVTSDIYIERRSARGIYIYIDIYTETETYAEIETEG